MDGVFGSSTAEDWHDYENDKGLGGGYVVDGTGLTSEWTWLKDNALTFEGYYGANDNYSYWQAVGLTGPYAFYRQDYPNDSQWEWYTVRSGTNSAWTPVDTTR
ncbi:hypothetical protein [Euzebya sp.]|uniref:hypothetical protein n=1 Tax=Euzebya sp. TaxID=1971409 RepID=UPI0035184ECE